MAAGGPRPRQASGIFGAVVAVVTAAGWEVRYRAQAAEIAGEGYHLVYNRAVEGPFCFSLRRCYLNKFYRIEATNDRWDWEVAGLPFLPEAGKHGFSVTGARSCFAGWPITKGGYIFMPLQGKLLQRRHFQAASPIEMIKATLAADPVRRIVATLHPREIYSDAELEALRGIERFELATEFAAVAGWLRLCGDREFVDGADRIFCRASRLCCLRGLIFTISRRRWRSGGAGCVCGGVTAAALCGLFALVFQAAGVGCVGRRARDADRGRGCGRTAGRYEKRLPEGSL